jgi:benzoyl-CoA 2,3-dioxygenase component A
MEQLTHVRQHLIDPAACIRCNTCLESCPVTAISFDGSNYLVDAGVCDGCGNCKPDCPTGAIESYRVVPDDQLYTLDDQASWEELPEQAELDEEALQAAGATDAQEAHVAQAPRTATKAATMLYPPTRPARATVSSTLRVTTPEADNDIRHIVLDFGDQPHGLIEGQTIGIVPPGVDANGKPHLLRNYSVASVRDGETPGANDVALTVKRVIDSYDGKPYRGVASNLVCDAQVGDTLQCVGPFGNAFLLPLHREARLLMIAVGTGIAPFRSFVQYRQRHPHNAPGAMTLLYGGRAPDEMAYHDELAALPAEVADVRFAYSRVAGQAKTYVDDLLRQNAPAFAALLDDAEGHLYICGLRAMEDGVMAALQQICAEQGKDWDAIRKSMQASGRLHVETY